MRPIRPRTERAKPGAAIQAKWLTPHELAKLRALIATSKKAGDLHTWRRARAVWGYIKGKTVLRLVEELDVVRASVNNWIRWYDATGTESLKPRKAPGAAPRLSEEQRAKLTALIEAGPQAAGYMGGVWTGPRTGDLIRKTFGVRYHNHHVPRLLHQLGFSVQRPRKRLARADRDVQEVWLKRRLPAIKKSSPLPRCSRLRGRGELLAGRQPAPHVVSRWCAAAR